MDLEELREVGAETSKFIETDRIDNAHFKRMLWLKIALNESRGGYRGGRGSGVI